MVDILININEENLKHFDYLYDFFPQEYITQALELDVNTVLKMFFDNKKYIDPICKDKFGWVCSEK